ncbi:hypothetical protein BDL97_18G043700 [Sphagnum fallax]|nr:hypothetical protein BDL97_18G043700 [Sphagnum fallax]
MQPMTTMAQTTCPHAHLRLLLPMRMSGLMNLLSSSYRTRNPVVVVPSRISSSVVPDLSLLSISSRKLARSRRCRASVKAETGADDEQLETEEKEQQTTTQSTLSSFSPALEKDLSKAVRKTAATFAPRASSAKSKNPAQPGSTLYTIFEVQAYASMLVGGVLSFNLLFPSDQPDIWRLMGMWSVWMFTIPSLRARDCSTKEKDALNYLFLAIPLINVTLPLVWKSFAAVWSADVIAFLAMYAWKLEWLQQSTDEAQ